MGMLESDLALKRLNRDGNMAKISNLPYTVGSEKASMASSGLGFRLE